MQACCKETDPEAKVLIPPKVDAAEEQKPPIVQDPMWCSLQLFVDVFKNKVHCSVTNVPSICEQADWTSQLQGHLKAKFH